MRYQKTTVIRDEIGIHIRPASRIVTEARRFDAQIWIQDVMTGKSANAKSILMLLSLSLSGGKKVCISAEGDDAPEAVNVLARLVESELAEGR